MSNTYYEEKQVNIAQVRSQLGKPAFEDMMSAVTVATPTIEYDFIDLLGEPLSSGRIRNVQINPIEVEICNNEYDNFSRGFNLEYNQSIDVGAFSNIYKIKFNRISHDVTFWITVS